METQALEETQEAREVVFHRVSANLYRHVNSGGYYGLVKRGDKQFRRSLKTKDRKLADRRLSELRTQVGRLTISDDARLSFEDIAKRWMDTTKHTLKESTITRRETCIKNLSPFFAGVAIRNAQPQHCERWLTERGAKIAAQNTTDASSPPSEGVPVIQSTTTADPVSVPTTVAAQAISPS